MNQIPQYHIIRYCDGHLFTGKSTGPLTSGPTKGRGVLLQPFPQEKYLTPYDTKKSEVMVVAKDDGEVDLLFFALGVSEAQVEDLGLISVEEALTHRSPLIREYAISKLKERQNV